MKELMKMIDFKEIYSELITETTAKQKKIDIKAPVNIFYGVSEEGYLRLAFMSSTKCQQLESTKLLRVTQGIEGDKFYWTCFDLLNLDAQKVFFTFCENLIEAVAGSTDEIEALRNLKNRYNTWRTLFRKDFAQKIPVEILQGLFGELYYLKNHMSLKYGIDSAVSSWGGPDFLSKDFSIGTEWFEIKSVGANSSNVRISSLAQLSSETTGHLVVIRTEAMSDEFSNGESSIEELLKAILFNLTNIATKNTLIDKINNFCENHKIELTDECLSKKFMVKDVKHYKVDEEFPRITEKTVPFVEITAVEYSLSIAAINKYLEEIK